MEAAGQDELNPFSLHLVRLVFADASLDGQKPSRLRNLFIGSKYHQESRPSLCMRRECHVPCALRFMKCSQQLFGSPPTVIWVSLLRHGDPPLDELMQSMIVLASPSRVSIKFMIENGDIHLLCHKESGVLQAIDDELDFFRSGYATDPY